MIDSTLFLEFTLAIVAISLFLTLIILLLDRKTQKTRESKMTSHFENNWKEFMRGNLSERPPEKLDRYELARMFYEFGFSAGISSQ